MRLSQQYVQGLPIFWETSQIGVLRGEGQVSPIPTPAQSSQEPKTRRVCQGQNRHGHAYIGLSPKRQLTPQLHRGTIGPLGCPMIRTQALVFKRQPNMIHFLQMHSRRHCRHQSPNSNSSTTTHQNHSHRVPRLNTLELIVLHVLAMRRAPVNCHGEIRSARDAEILCKHLGQRSYTIGLGQGHGAAAPELVALEA